MAGAMVTGLLLSENVITTSMIVLNLADSVCVCMYESSLRMQLFCTLCSNVLSRVPLQCLGMYNAWLAMGSVCTYTDMRV